MTIRKTKGFTLIEIVITLAVLAVLVVGGYSLHLGKTVRVKFEGKRWADDLAQIVRHVTQGLGVSGLVEAELYKLLVYDTGSFFISHRDTEKAPGMFATQ